MEVPTQGTILLAPEDPTKQLVALKKYKFFILAAIRENKLRFQEIPEEMQEEFIRNEFFDKSENITPYGQFVRIL